VADGAAIFGGRAANGSRRWSSKSAGSVGEWMMLWLVIVARLTESPTKV
jgi:hypothetical protein